MILIRVSNDIHRTRYLPNGPKELFTQDLTLTTTYIMLNDLDKYLGT